VRFPSAPPRDYMSKFYNPRDYDLIGFGNNRRHVPISDEEKRKRADI